MRGSAPYRDGLLIILALCLLATACRKDPAITDKEVTPREPAFLFSIPEGWPAPVYQFQSNPLTAEGFELGRRLFFDKRLSRDNAVSCGSCHQPSSAFAQQDHNLSRGVDGRTGIRNSPGLFNLNWHPSFFWDGGVNHIENQPVAPIQNPVEMDGNLLNILSALRQDTEYRKRFKSVFGDTAITSQRMFRALAQFMGMLVSADSKYDKYKRGATGGSMTENELNGLRIFRTRCSGCHREPLFTDFSFRGNGLKPTSANDSGRAHITGNPQDLYRFKVPSLRNLGYTAPYMHDGRLGTLGEVLDHYASGIDTMVPNLDPALRNGIRLSPQERRDLLTFLNTLNDESFVRNPRFSEP